MTSLGNVKTDDKWIEFRQKFSFAGRGEPANLAALALASNPTPVRKAIEVHRDAFDHTPFDHLQRLHIEEEEVCRAVSDYFGLPHDMIALTSGTTQGLSLLHAGVIIGPGQEILTTQHEFSGALETFRLRGVRAGTTCRQVPMLLDPSKVTVDSVLGTLRAAVCSHTRVLALTWVYSNTGVKLPVAEIADWLAKDINAFRSPANQVLLCIDGVHGFGTESVSFRQLGCHFFVAGCHKWIYGPRGTGVWCGTKEAWEQYVPIGPTSSREEKPGLRNSPGGVHPYEHQWALQEAFRFLLEVGPGEIQHRVHTLASAVKKELASIDGITVITPMSAALSSGIICFDLAGKTAKEVVDDLHRRKIITTVSSSDAGRPNARHVRLSIAPFNEERELQHVIDEIASLARPG